MSKPKVLLIKTGGTIVSKPNLEGLLEPTNENFLYLIKGLEDLAEIETVDVGGIDSTDMETKLPNNDGGLIDRAKIATAIYKNAHKYDGFVVTHGTDSMAETAAALTYMVQELRKPIVLTGSQRSIWAHRSDAQNNVYTAVQAATMDIGEVVVAFGNHLWRGTRVTKVDEEGYDAFKTPDTQYLGKITALSESIRLLDHRVRRGDGDPKLFTDFDTRVFHYAPISGANVQEDLMRIADSDYNHGIILGSFGAGNIPTKLLDFISKAKDRSKPVFVYTRCEIGAADMGIYSVGAAPLKRGAKSAGDMTLEALGQKLMYAMGRAMHEGLSGEEKLKFVESIIRKPYNFDIMVTERRK